MARAVNFYAEFLAFVGLLLMGIGFLAVLPPFEGFDETAHYSSLRQIADTGMLPITGSSFIDKNVIDYRRHGPKSYADPGSYEDRSGFLYFSFLSLLASLFIFVSPVNLRIGITPVPGWGGIIKLECV